MDDDLDFFGHEDPGGFGDELPEQDEILQEFDDNGVESDFIAELESVASRDSDDDADRILMSQRGPMPDLGFEFDSPGMQDPQSPNADAPPQQNDPNARARAQAFQLDDEMGDLGEDGRADGSSNRIYGTTLTQEAIMGHCVDFIRRYEPDQDGVGKYDAEMIKLLTNFMDQSKEDSALDVIPLLIDASDIANHNMQFYSQLTLFAKDVMAIFDKLVWELARRRTGNQDPPVFRVQVHNLLERSHRSMRDINDSDVDTLITIKGIVIRCSELIPDMQHAFFQCVTTGCDGCVVRELKEGVIDEPQRCEACQRKGMGTFTLVHNNSTFGDKQLIKLQESPEMIPEGETPHTVQLYAYDDMFDRARPGDRVEVTGIFRAVPVRSSVYSKAEKSVYRTFLDVVYMDLNTENKLAFDPDGFADNGEKITSEELFERLSINEETRAEIRELEMLPKEDLVKVLCTSVAPSVHGEADVKKGLLCQLFGGATKKFAQSSRGRFRGELNILLCGDPSTAKSQLLQYVHKTSPRGIYVSGKGSSAVGLTAFITRDPDTKELVLESGALVLSDRGICCIDEFDKMDDNTRAILHEVMEQQTVSVAKAGIVCSLNARTAILASANPVASRYETRKSVVENIDLAPALMSRFDLIYLMLDKYDEALDRKLASHLVGMFSKNAKKAIQTEGVNPQTLGAFISYARHKYSFPVTTDAAVECLIKEYKELRQNQGNVKSKVVSATVRQLESLLRLSEALAKMELSKEVTELHVQEAVRLIKAALYSAAVNPQTGLFDLEQLITGKSAGARARENKLRDVIMEVIRADQRKTVPLADLFTRVVTALQEQHAERVCDESEFLQAAFDLVNTSDLSRTGPQNLQGSVRLIL